MKIGRGTGGVPCGDPCASKPTIMPVKTSPVPAVAMPGLPVGQMATSPSGRAMTVRAPFKTTNTPRSRANRLAVPIRSALTLCVVASTFEPGHLTRVRGENGWSFTFGQQRGPAGQGVERIGIEDGGPIQMLHERLHEFDGFVMCREPRTDGDRRACLDKG